MKRVISAAGVAAAIAAFALSGCDRTATKRSDPVAQYGADAGYRTPGTPTPAPGMPNPMPGSPIADAGITPAPPVNPTPPSPGPGTPGYPGNPSNPGTPGNPFAPGNPYAPGTPAPSPSPTHP